MIATLTQEHVLCNVIEYLNRDKTKSIIHILTFLGCITGELFITPICYKLNLLYNNATQETNYWFPIYGLLSRVINTSEFGKYKKRFKSSFFIGCYIKHE